LQKQIKSVEQELMADVEFSKRINASKRAFNDGNTAYKKGQYELALQSYDEAISLNDSYDVAFYGKGLSLNKLRRYDEAIAAFKKATEINPTYAAAFSALGSALNQVGRRGEAVTALLKAIEIDPSSSTTVYNLGAIYQAQKNSEEAIRYFRMARK
jgi:superkiller protein 3